MDKKPETRSKIVDGIGDVVSSIPDVLMLNAVADGLSQAGSAIGDIISNIELDL